MRLNRSLKPLLRSAMLATTFLAVTGTMTLAQDDALLQPLAYAPAALRQDIVEGAYEVAEAPALGQVFVSSTPSFDGKKPGFLHVLGADDLHQIRRVQLPRRAFALTYAAQTGQLYVGNTIDGSISVVDAASGLVTHTIQLGRDKGADGFEHVRMIGLDEGRGLMFVTSPSDTGTVWIVDTKAAKVLHRIDDAGLWAAGLAYDAQAGRIYVGGGGPQEVSVIDVVTGKRVGGLSTGDTPADAGKDGSKHFFVNLDIDVAGQRLFAADAHSGQLYVFDLKTGQITDTVKIGLGTLDVLYNAARDEIYLTWRGASREVPTGTGGLAVVDGTDLSLRQNLSLPSHPNSLGLGDDGRLLYVTVKAPHGDDHPNHVQGGSDAVLRFDLDKLARIK